MRPTAAILEQGDPFGEWLPVDYRLQTAMHMLNQEMCKQCGNPTWLCRTAVNTVEFEIHETVCYATQALEEFEALPGTPEKVKGGTRYARAVGLKNEDGTFDPLPSRREGLGKVSDTVVYDPQ